jgi:hypothetical protein
MEECEADMFGFIPCARALSNKRSRLNSDRARDGERETVGRDLASARGTSERLRTHLKLYRRLQGVSASDTIYILRARECDKSIWRSCVLGRRCVLLSGSITMCWIKERFLRR